MNFEQFQSHLADDANVSRETFEHFQTWYNLLSVWNKKINLVSAATLHDFWLRHALDSWQIVGLLPQNDIKHTKTILDMGAGAGFPGVALAIALKNTQGAQIDLVESNGKKCNFLRTVIRECALPANVVQDRVEYLEPKSYDVITARAFAPLPKLLKYSLPFWSKDKYHEIKAGQTIGIFPKGERWQDEVTAARKRFDFDLTTTPSQTGEAAMILTVTNLRRKGTGVQ